MVLILLKGGKASPPLIRHQCPPLSHFPQLLGIEATLVLRVFCTCCVVSVEFCSSSPRPPGQSAWTAYWVFRHSLWYRHGYQTYLLREFASWLLLWVGDRNLWVTNSWLLPLSQEGLRLGMRRTLHKHFMHHTVGLRSTPAPVLEISSSSVLGFSD